MVVGRDKKESRVVHLNIKTPGAVQPQKISFCKEKRRDGLRLEERTPYENQRRMTWPKKSP